MASGNGHLIHEFSEAQKGANRNCRFVNDLDRRTHVFIKHPARNDELNAIAVLVESHSHHHGWLTGIARIANYDDTSTDERMKAIGDLSWSEFMSIV